VQPHPEPLGDLLGDLGPRPALGADEVHDLRVQLDRAATAARLVHQPRHPRLIERGRHQIERCPRITVCCSGFGHRHTLDQTRSQHLVLHLHLVGGQKEA
jgi:hypothetical protein